MTFFPLSFYNVLCWVWILNLAPSEISPQHLLRICTNHDVSCINKSLTLRKLTSCFHVDFRTYINKSLSFITFASKIKTRHIEDHWSPMSIANGDQLRLLSVMIIDMLNASSDDFSTINLGAWWLEAKETWARMWKPFTPCIVTTFFLMNFQPKVKKVIKQKVKKVKNPTKENVKDVLDDVDYHRTPTRNNI